MIREAYHPRPDELCFGCFGRGFHVERGGQGRACLVCQGHATAGVFAVQVAAERPAPVRMELNGETPSYRRAVAAAIRAATLASLRVRRARPAETRVVYYPADGSPARVLYRVPVVIPQNGPVAA